MSSRPTEPHPAAAWWRPDRFARRRAWLEARAELLAGVRRFFTARDYLEVETPALQVSPGMEPHLMVFQTDLTDGDGARGSRYLHTSPEFAMKKLVVAGLPRIFQLAHVFRNAERGSLHHPEFTMLEWYRVGADYTDLMDEAEALLRHLAPAYRFRGRVAHTDRPFERLSVPDAFARYAGIDLFAVLGPDPGPITQAAASAGVGVHEGDDWSDIFHRILLDRIEHRLGDGVPTFLYDYPTSLGALARRKPSDPRLAERFELYACGVELANAFGELTDPVEQRARFADDVALKRARYGIEVPVDEDFLAALAYGMPDVSGAALGIDRLVLLAVGAERVEDVIWAPVTGISP